MTSRKLLMSIVALVSFLIVCAAPILPPLGELPTIDAAKSFSAIGDTLYINKNVSCTLSINNGNNVDSFVVYASTKQSNTKVRSGGKIANDTVQLDLPVLALGENTFTFYILDFTGAILDSATKKVLAVAQGPSIHPDSSEIHVQVGDTAHLAISITDPDSNLYKLYFWQDTLESKKDSISFSPKTSSIKRTVHQVIDTSKELMRSVHFSAMDFNLNVSSIATVLIKVTDSIKPTIAFYSDTTIPVAVLPDTLAFGIADNWGIDSAHFNKDQDLQWKNDTALIVIATLDTGKTLDSLTVTDRGGNTITKRFHLTYHGIKTYPPKLVSILRPPRQENAPVDTLFLDTLVTLTDPSTTYTKNQLTWTITPVTVDSGLTFSFNSSTHKLAIFQTSTELGADKKAIIGFKVTDPKNLSDYQQATFWFSEKNDPPSITMAHLFCNTLFNPRVLFSRVNVRNVLSDPDPYDPVDTLKKNLTWTNGKIIEANYYTDLIPLNIGIGPMRYMFRVTDSLEFTTIKASDSTWIGSDTLTFTTSDSKGLGTTKKVIFTRGSLVVIFPPPKF